MIYCSLDVEKRMVFNFQRAIKYVCFRDLSTSSQCIQIMCKVTLLAKKDSFLKKIFAGGFIVLLVL